MAAGRVPVAIGIDLGTTRVKAVAFDGAGRPVAEAERPAPIAYPRPGWVETDAEALVSAGIEAAREAFGRAGGSPAGRPIAVGVANQRSTTVLWDRATGRPVAPAVSWRCGRAADLVERLRSVLGDRFPATTGLPLTRHWFAGKLAWLLENVPDARAGAEAGRLAAGTLDAYFAARTTGLHATDVSNAARTGLADLSRLDWDAGLLDAFRIPRACLPAIRPSAAVLGPIGPALAPAADARLAGLAGDAGAALLGLAPAGAKVTLGTGAFVHVAVPARPAATNGLFAAPAYALGPGPGDSVRWTLEGSTPSAGAGLEWVRRLAGRDVEPPPVPLDRGPVLVPAFAGLGAPTWDDRLRATVLDLDEGDGAEALAGAALEAVAFQVADVLDALPAAARPGRLVADGGLARRRDLLALVAALSGTEVAPSVEAEATARGAALLAGIAVGLWPAGAPPPAATAPPVPSLPPSAAARAAERRSRWRAALRRLQEDDRRRE